MVHGDVYFSYNYCNLNCFDNDNDNKDTDLKNMILNNNHSYELEEDCNIFKA